MRSFSFTISRGALFAAGLLAGAGPSLAREAAGSNSPSVWPDSRSISNQALALVSRQKGVFTAPPLVMPTRKMPDGPLLGNGDLGVAIGGVIERQRRFGLGASGGADVNIQVVAITNSPERHRFWIAKNDFWKTKSIYPNAHPCPIGGIDVTIPALLNGSYHAEQNFETAEVVHTPRTIGMLAALAGASAAAKGAAP